jgi:hypothetical protein
MDPDPFSFTRNIGQPQAQSFSEPSIPCQGNKGHGTTDKQGPRKIIEEGNHIYLPSNIYREFY